MTEQKDERYSGGNDAPDSGIGGFDGGNLVPDDESPWFTSGWLRELTRYGERFEIGYSELAELMAKYQTVEAIRAHMARLSGVDLAAYDPFVGREVPADVAKAVLALAELNEWAILNVASDQEKMLPSGEAASELLRTSFDPEARTFTFTRDH